MDFLALVSEQVKLKRQGSRWVGLCPFHSEKTPSFTVSPDLGFYKCFGCGAGGDLFSFVQQRERVDFREALEWLADRAGVDLAPRGRSDGRGRRGDTEVSRSQVAKANDWAAGYFRRMLEHESYGAVAREYLASRRMSAEAVERFEIGLACGPQTCPGMSPPGLASSAADAGFSRDVLLAADLGRRSYNGGVEENFVDRLMFPIRDTTGRVVGFGGRTLAGHKAKYVNTRQTLLFDKGRGLYGLYQARDAIVSSGRVILVEGYTDCIAVSSAGFPEVVASLGTALTAAQVELLRRYADEIVLLFDADSAGETAADRAIGVALPRCVTVRMTSLPDGKDPAEFLGRSDASAFERVLNGAVDALEFKWQKVQRRFEGSDSARVRHEAVMDFLDVVATGTASSAVDAIERGLLVNRVAHLLRMNNGEVDEMLRRLQRRKVQAAERQRDPGSPVRGDQAGEGSTGAARRSDGDRGQSPFTHLLEVVLNESGLLGMVPHEPGSQEPGSQEPGSQEPGSHGGFTVLEPSLMEDECERRILSLALQLYEELGEFTIGDLIARCELREDAEWAAELAARGAARGNYEATFRVALERIARLTQIPELDERAPELLAPGTGGDKVTDSMRRHRHFAPRRLLRRAAGQAGSPENADTHRTTSLE